MAAVTGWRERLKSDRGVLVLFVFYLLAFPILFRPFIHGADTVGYYSWLRSAIIDGDLNVANEFDHFALEFDESSRAIDLSRTTATGYRHNQWASGSAILWLPLFLVAHGLTMLAHRVGAGPIADGYTWPYQFAASLASTFYSLGAMWFTYRIAKHYFGTFAATLASLTVWFSTPLVFYMYSHPLMSHANGAFVIALFVYVWWKTQASSSVWCGVWRGLAAGLATWVRTQNAVLIVVLGMEVVADLVIAARHSHDSLWLIVRRGAVTLAGYLLLFVPLMAFWRVVFGAWVYNTYYATQGPGFLNWTAPHVLEVFFSSNRGMFTWAPITLMSLVGLRWLYEINRRMTLVLVGVFTCQLYVIGSWFAWSGGVAFGPRFWANMIVVFTLGLVALIQRLPRIPRQVIVGVCSAFILWNVLLIVQYALETIPRSGPVDLVVMGRNQFLVIPNHLTRLIQALTTRH